MNMDKETEDLSINLAVELNNCNDREIKKNKDRTCGGKGEIMKKLVLVLLAILLMAATAQAGGLQVTWDANTETDLAGYRVHYFYSGLTEWTVVDTGNVTSCDIVMDDALIGKLVSICVTAYDTSGNESDASEIVKKLYLPIPDDEPIVVNIQGAVVINIGQ
jgi:hypothetical protein